MSKIFKIIKSVRKNIIELKPYSSARDEFKGKADVFLDANENAYGNKAVPNFNRYPDPLQSELKAEISDWKKISKEKIFLGNGSDEAIDILFRIFCTPGKDEVIICPPTYGMYEVSATINDVKIKKVNLINDFQLDVKRILKNISIKTKMIFICSPNNPTGNLMQEKSILKISASFNGLVILDEAYIDFAPGKSFLNKLKVLDNLVILQTFSKAGGLAGLRLGMAFANEKVIDLMNKVKPPYNINQFSIDAGLKSIPAHKKSEKLIREFIGMRKKLAKDLNDLKCVVEVFPSDANFLLVKMKNAKKAYDYLSRKGIVVRDRSSVIKDGNCLRITIGTSQENKKLMDCLKKIDNEK